MTNKEILKEFFGYDDFRPNQEKIIEHIQKGRDAIVIAETSYGKSIVFQLPALTFSGITIVVSPLISLMQDQVDSLVKKGIPATLINSSISLQEQKKRIADCISGKYKLLYISPERFENKKFCEDLKYLDVSLFAIDESHCISSWGHDFRPSYLALGDARSYLGNPTTIALTATATPLVRKDIKKHLHLPHNVKEFLIGFKRENLSIEVIHTNTVSDKNANLLEIIERHQKGIIYCSSIRAVGDVCDFLNRRGYDALGYHADLPDKKRAEIQEKFMNKKIDLIVATPAFGMGIDRDDVRFVVNYQIPGSLEECYQNLGRAGRDQKPSYGYVFYARGDVRIHNYFIEISCPREKDVKGIYYQLLDMCPTNDSVKNLSIKLGYINNEGIIQGCLNVLKDGGMIRRVDVKGQRTKRTEIVNAAQLLKLDWSSIEKKRKMQLTRLQSMVDFCVSTQCRERFILNYFEALSENELDYECEKCDVCNGIF